VLVKEIAGNKQEIEETGVKLVETGVKIIPPKFLYTCSTYFSFLSLFCSFFRKEATHFNQN
jgi:hypothetical protein